MTMKKLLRVENLSKEQILHQISFDMEPGEMLAVMGPSGNRRCSITWPGWISPRLDKFGLAMW